MIRLRPAQPYPLAPNDVERMIEDRRDRISATLKSAVEFARATGVQVSEDWLGALAVRIEDDREDTAAVGRVKQHFQEFWR